MASLKYGKNPCLQSTYVGVPWSIVDTCQTVKNKVTPKHSDPNEKTLKWKMFNDYDTADSFKKHVKESLK